MKMTLRKVNALQLEIAEKHKLIQLDLIAELSEFDNKDETIAAKQAKYLVDLERKIKLNDILYKLRKQVSVANHVSGVNDVLNEMARIEKTIGVYSTVANSQPMVADHILTARLDKIRNRSSEVVAQYYGRDETISTYVVTNEELDKYKMLVAKLKKQKQALQDQLLELNVRNEIVIDSDTVAVLESEQLL